MIFIILFMLFSCVLYFIKKRINMALLKKSYLTKSITPQTTILAFDIHGVLFKPDKYKIKKIIKSNPKAFVVLIYIFHPFFWFDIWKLLRKKAVPEEIITHLSSRYSLIAQHKKLAIELANAQKHINHMESMISDLKEIGYELHIFSNISSDIFKELSAQHRKFFKQFDKIYIPHSDNNFIGKPHAQTYHDYLKRCNSIEQQVIFIDNRWINIKNAHCANIFGIHFKSGSQLTAELEKLGVINKTIANTA